MKRLEFNKLYIVYYLPFFLVIVAGREFSGVGFFFALITLSIAISITFSTLRAFNRVEFRHVFFSVLLVVASILSYYQEINWAYYFSLLNLIEDIYSLFILIFFVFIGRFFFSNPNLKLEPMLKIAIIGTFINFLVTISIYQENFTYFFFQRLWNTYAIFFIIFAYIVYKNKISFTASIILTLFILGTSTSFQSASIAVFLLFLLLIKQSIIEKFNYKFIAITGIFSLALLQIFFLKIDPMLLNQFDHNFAVRSIFWREALTAFLDKPFGFNIGVSVISGNMTAIGEASFHGEDANLSDLGVHSGLMSILYKFGIFSLILFAWVSIIIIKPNDNNLSSSDKKFLTFVLFTFILTIFSNDSVFAPHFSASVGFMLGIFQAYSQRSKLLC
jgi:hypothetical protein